jgi:hypothetical protein
MQEFRPRRAGEQGDEAPPPAPPTLFPVFRFQEAHVDESRYEPITF